MRLSIVIPFYNERNTLEPLVTRALAADILGWRREIVMVDDASTDGSSEIARRLAADHAEIRLLSHPRNRGKSAALITGFADASGDYILVQDADLEYDPGDYNALLAPVIAGEADIVYGSRFLKIGDSVFLGFNHRVGNRVITWLSNRFTGLGLSDVSTCYKLFPREVLARVTLKEQRFGFCPEFTAKAARLRPRLRFREVPVAYHSRTYAEGKKIDWRHGVRAIYCIVRYSLGR